MGAKKRVKLLNQQYATFQRKQYSVPKEMTQRVQTEMLALRGGRKRRPALLRSQTSRSGSSRKTIDPMAHSFRGLKKLTRASERNQKIDLWAFKRRPALLRPETSRNPFRVR